jgi:hypothetical protein
MLFARTELLRTVPFDERLRRHGDLDWLVRSDQRDDVRLEVALEDVPLAIWEIQQDRQRMSNNRDWRDSHAWVDRVRDLVTARAYAGFLLTWVSFSARCQGDVRAFTFLLREAFRRGSPGVVELAVHFAIWVLPLTLRDKLSHTWAETVAAAPGPVRPWK